MLAPLNLHSHQLPKPPPHQNLYLTAQGGGEDGTMKGLKHVGSGRRFPATCGPVGLGGSWNCGELLSLSVQW